MRPSASREIMLWSSRDSSQGPDRYTSALSRQLKLRPSHVNRPSPGMRYWRRGISVCQTSQTTTKGATQYPSRKDCQPWIGGLPGLNFQPSDTPTSGNEMPPPANQGQSG